MAWNNLDGSGPGGVYIVGDNWGHVQINGIRDNFIQLSDFQYMGSGSPEGTVVAPIGALYRQKNGGPGTTLYIKESGASSTGWRAVETAPPPSPLLTLTATLTDLNIKQLPTTPFQVAPSPGPGKRNRFIGASTFLDTTAGAYTNVFEDDAHLAFYTETIRLSTYIHNYTLGPATDTRLTDYLTNAHKKVADYVVLTEQPVAQMGSPTELVDKPMTLQIDNDPAGDLTGGNAANLLKVTVYYMVENL